MLSSHPVFSCNSRHIERDLLHAAVRPLGSARLGGGPIRPRVTSPPARVRLHCHKSEEINGLFVLQEDNLNIKIARFICDENEELP
ncbi:hypothetical protein AGIG_G17349 [Arapaima gigas]